MGKKKQARVIEPQSRDPQPAIAPQEDRMPVRCVYVPIAQCKCGGTVWREGGTSQPNPLSGEMLRWRKCRDCGTPIWIRSPMDDNQRRKYLPPD